MVAAVRRSVIPAVTDDQPTRQSLLQRLKHSSGNRDWEDFYRQYAGVILRFCRYRGLDEWSSRDVLQETMILVIRKLPVFEYDPARGRFRNWLLTLVSGKVRDAMRRSHRAQVSSLEDPASAAAVAAAIAPDLGGVQALDNAWRHSIVEEALERIQRDPKTKPGTLAVFRACFAGQDVAEVARAFQLQPNAVSQIKDRLSKRLRAEIAALEERLGQAAL